MSGAHVHGGRETAIKMMVPSKQGQVKSKGQESLQPLANSDTVAHFLVLAMRTLFSTGGSQMRKRATSQRLEMAGSLSLGKKLTFLYSVYGPTTDFKKHALTFRLP